MHVGNMNITVFSKMGMFPLRPNVNNENNYRHFAVFASEKDECY
jgi:hypothetical protein